MGSDVAKWRVIKWNVAYLVMSCPGAFSKTSSAGILGQKNDLWLMISSILIPQEEDMGHSKEKKEKKMTAIKLKSKKNLGPDILGLNCEHASEDYKSFLEHLNSSRTWTSKK